MIEARSTISLPVSFSDIGESTRPGAELVPVEEEKRRVAQSLESEKSRLEEQYSAKELTLEEERKRLQDEWDA